MAKYRTALIACGWLDVPGQPTQIAACADTHPDARRKFGDFFGIAPECRSRLVRGEKMSWHDS